MRLAAAEVTVRAVIPLSIEATCGFCCATTIPRVRTRSSLFSAGAPIKVRFFFLGNILNFEFLFLEL